MQRVWIGTSSITPENTTSRYLSANSALVAALLSPAMPRIVTRFGAPRPVEGGFDVFDLDAPDGPGRDVDAICDRLPFIADLPGLAAALAEDREGQRLRSVFFVLSEGDPRRVSDGCVTLTDVIDVDLAVEVEAPGAEETGPTGFLHRPGEPFAIAFKPALLSGSKTWQLQGNMLTGPQGPLDLTQVTEVGLSQTHLRASVIRETTLIHLHGRFRIGCNSTTTKGADMRGLGLLTDAILSELAVINPDLPVHMGYLGGQRVAMFIVGLLAALFALGMGIALMAGSGRTGFEIVIVLIGMLLFGAMLTWQNAPWRKVPSLPVSLAPVILAARRR